MSAYRNSAARSEPVIFISEERLRSLGLVIRERRPKTPWESTVLFPLVVVACGLHPAWWDVILVMLLSGSNGWLWQRWNDDMDVWRKGMAAVEKIKHGLGASDG
jgi:hypothetical protein